jgi:predicted kinase
MRKLCIIRGLPGSGKSCLAKVIKQEASITYDTQPVICSTDNFWDKETGTYNYRPHLLDIAHGWCRGIVCDEMLHQRELIILDNTNTTFKEIAPYLELAAAFGYDVDIFEPTNPWSKDPNECVKRCTHNVPLTIIQKMAERWENISITS